ncbi:MAG: 30S ribosomal protein S17 [Flavobacteriales bacterium]|jgi:small subunit ribosomal protein S17|nr:30S ribosomal protein S17 [Flavobacteriales bacterium]
MSTETTTTVDRNLRKERVGIVTSDKMSKSITVIVERRVMHPKYGKFVKRSSKFMAHDEKGDAHVGDTVRIAETRPMSKLKRWRLVEVVERAK